MFTCMNRSPFLLPFVFSPDEAHPTITLRTRPFSHTYAIADVAEALRLPFSPAYFDRSF
jgi:hypothetical protein